jgi:hypothetical protein
MCEHCCNFSRRDVLKAGAAALGAAALGALGGCAEAERADLPDAYEDHLVQESGGGRVKIDPKKLIVPPPLPAQASEYGSIMPRAAWTAMPLALRNGLEMNGVNKITIHHSGDGKPFMGNTTMEVARHLQVVQQAHLQRGMIDIAYHFAVDRMGRVWQLRWLQYEGQHVRIGKNGQRNNEHNIGVVVIGDFNKQAVTVPQRDRLVELVQLLAGKYGLTAAQNRPRANTVFMHGELVDTDCPGSALKPLVMEARRGGRI